MPRKKKRQPSLAGKFRPAIPADTQEVMQLYVIGARAVCARADLLEEVSDRIALVTGGLVPPESMTAAECWNLWSAFSRVATSPKTKLRQEAGKALYRDLESLAQRLDQSPLQSWDNTPEGIDEPNAPEPAALCTEGSDVAKVRAHAKQRLEAVGDKGQLSGTEVALLLSEMDGKARVELFSRMIGDGMFGRSECNMLEQVLARGVVITDEDEALIEVLDRMGKWMVAAE